MENLNPVQPEPEGTRVRHILAQRGVIVVNETREVGTLNGPYDDYSISVSTMILAIMKGTGCETSFGVRLEWRPKEASLGRDSVLLDFDELDGLIGAFDFISSFANEEREPALVTYSTKDYAKLGFSQHAGRQAAFVALDITGRERYVPFELFPRLRDLLLAAQRHLTSRGASDV